MLPLVLAFLVLSACATARKPAPASSPSYVYVTPDSKVVEQRSNELQRKGYSPAEAKQKAAREADGQAWQVDQSAVGADEQARQAAEREQDKLNASLRKTAFDRNGP